MSNHTLKTLSDQTGISITDIGYSLSIPPTEISPQTPVSAKKASDFLKVHQAASSPNSGLQKQLTEAGGVEDKSMLKTVATQLDVPQRLVKRINELKVQNAYTSKFAETEQELIIKRVEAIAVRDAKLANKQGDNQVKETHATEDLLAELEALERDAIRQAQVKTASNGFLDAFNPASIQDKVNLELARREAREETIRKIQTEGYIPTDEELSDFFIQQAYQSVTRLH